MGLLNRLRGKTKKNTWRNRPNIIRSADYINTKPSVNKSRIIGISSAKASPTQGLQNWFVRSFTRKQKNTNKKHTRRAEPFEPVFPPIERSEAHRIENDPFNLSGFNAFENSTMNAISRIEVELEELNVIKRNLINDYKEFKKRVDKFMRNVRGMRASNEKRLNQESKEIEQFAEDWNILYREIDDQINQKEDERSRALAIYTN